MRVAATLEGDGASLVALPPPPGLRLRPAPTVAGGSASEPTLTFASRDGAASRWCFRRPEDMAQVD